MRPSRSATAIALIVLLAVSGITVGAARPAATSRDASADDGPRPVTAEDLEHGFPISALQASPAWTLEAAEGGAVARALDDGAFAFRLKDVGVFAFDARVSRGDLALLLDGVVVKRLIGVKHERFDVALPLGEHKLEWQFTPRSEPAEALVQLVPGAPVEAPRILDTVVRPISSCGGLPSLLVVFALPLDAPAVTARIDGVKVPTSVFVRPHGLTLLSHVHVHAPAGLAVGAHELVVEAGILGIVEELLDTVLLVVDPLPPWTSPGNGWVYDRSPAIDVHVPCGGHAIRLVVDGEEVVNATGVGGLHWRLPREMAFNETLTYVAEVTTPAGRVHKVERTLRQGLDVVEFEVSGGAIWATQLGSSFYFGNPKRPNELPPVKTAPDEHLSPVYVPTTFGARVRAEYAPLELACRETVNGTSACAPYGGGAPQYRERRGHLAAATVAPKGGAWPVEASGLGQIVAASYLSRPEAPELPPLLIEERIRDALRDIMPIDLPPPQ